MILSTVVFMFLDRSRIPAIIQNMRQLTVAGAIQPDCDGDIGRELPLRTALSFPFKEDEVSRYYEAWEIVKYSQDVGEWRKTSEDRKRIELRFATLLARKWR
ncbi:hypothetical protein [Lonsdalea populi]|uniref:hypothetical protein n=1 Tax=Lonsdalea populi TaxID=1172565 RepID=UPI000A266B32|nr:hypothetical protein [Lonsdalea populi]OSM94210.1 hypothetical protein AU508_14885 [Lonsdalea populi]RAT71675.1 hypothetical protein AU506_15705 [Lonsdalea populi]RAT72455.1 hypothetical protein AU505_06715 [Lonsdalea populi]RAT72533.1 hypothetical protein AU504_02855 [Lonsdalea populi]RAT78730.1 hypothetical protein AU507_07310 [Lonsdalea populi]